MIENLENEQWLPIEGYEELYQVSNLGRVKSLERIDNLGRTVKEKILKASNDKDGYKQVGLCKDGKIKWFRVHRLVAMAFIQNPNNYPVVNHKDEVKANNHVENLEWCSAKYNCNYGIRNEKISKAFSGESHPMYGKFGKDNPNSKQVIQLNLNGEVIKIWSSTHDVERELGYRHGNISSCCKGKLPHAYKYKWVYA